jgi:hypothetical protein
VKLGICSREGALLAARRASVGLDEEARRHAASCPACASALAAEATLAPLARGPLPAALPPAAVALLRARLFERRSAIERSVAPLAIWRGLSLLAALGGAVTVGSRALASGLELAAGRATVPTAAHLIAGFGLLLIASLPFLRSLRWGESGGR